MMKTNELTKNLKSVLKRELLIPQMHRLPQNLDKSALLPKNPLSKSSKTKLEAQGPCTGHRSIIAILYCFSFKYMKREKGRDLTQYTNLCGLTTLPH